MPGCLRTNERGISVIDANAVEIYLSAVRAQAERQRQRQAIEAHDLEVALSARSETTRRRIRALKARQSALPNDGAPIEPGQALAQMLETSGARDRALDAAAAARHEMSTGALRYHKLARED